MYNSSDFLFVPLGGSGEIGMNANLYHYEGSWLMVDLGISFPDDSMPGIDVVLPDLSFIEARREQLAGLVLTHGHEDHLGAIPYMWSKLGCPVYGSAFTLALLRRKLAENNNTHDIPLIELSPGMVEDIGAFSVEMVGMAHSIPDPTSLAIRCDAGTVLHTGDWKFDESPGLGTDTDSNRLAEIHGGAATDCQNTVASVCRILLEGFRYRRLGGVSGSFVENRYRQIIFKRIGYFVDKSGRSDARICGYEHSLDTGLA